MKALLAAICLTGLAATVQAQTPSDPAAGGDAKAEKTVTVTGCLQQSTEAPGTFTLVRTGDGQDKNKGDKKYRVESTGAVKLNEHVGHKVEVTGKLAASAPDTGTGTGTKPPVKETMGAIDGVVSVTALKHISETCK